jgi:hypothetical protein
MYTIGVRTTIELRPDHRARLLETAARRGDKGFSSLIADALDLYFNSLDELDRRRAVALRLRACLTPPEAAALEDALLQWP